MSTLARVFLTIAIAVVIALAILFFSRTDCPSGQTWVLSDDKWVCMP